ncbi:MAG: hypothetical protein DMD35_06440 [Gemmatimonadetes bacterium]|nr:MAG: hypothetical protein DMD35_06440 [Gemmatimonadota bacterium]
MIDSDLKTLEERIEALERRKRPSWVDKRDILEVFAKALLPIAIALAGHLFGRALSRAQVEAAERLRQRDVASARELKERDIAVSMQHSRAQQASVVNTFMQALLSENQRHRQLAIKAALIALPQDGPNLVDAIRATDAGSPIAQFAADALTQRRDDLIHGLFADSASVQVAAANGLVEGWRTRADIVPVLLDSATRRADDPHAVYNTLGVLDALDPDVIRADAGAVRAFAERAKVGPNRGEIGKLAHRVIGKLSG